jgi:Type II secretion system (T2SS), protein E, N-terminal domain
MEGHVITPTETAAVDSSDEALADAGAQRVATPHRPAAFLSDVIVELGFVDGAVVERAEQEGRLHSRSVTDVLLENGELTEEQLARAIAQRSGLEYVDLDDFDIDLGAAELISQSVARRYRAVPIASNAAGELVVAIADPVDALAADDIAVIAKSNVRTVVAGRSAIDAVITCLPEDAPPPPAPDELSHDDESERDSAPGAPPDDAEETTEGSPGLTAATEPTDPDPSGGTQPEARSAASRATASPRLQERIIQLIDSALDSAVESEAEALEAELASERDKRSDLEAELERERTSRSGERGEWMAEREALTEARDRLERERGELAELQREMGERVTAVSEKNAELQSLLAELRGSLDSADQRS